MSIRFAENEKITLYRFEVDQILDIVSQIKGEPGIARAQVTDESALSDFGLRPSDYEMLGVWLGIPIRKWDSILWKAAERLRHARTGKP